MREIKFRAWDEGNKIMHNNFQFIKSGNEGNDWIVFVSDKQRIQDGFEECISNPYFQQQLKIMQYTGLKDRTGKEIYEGDIVSDSMNNGKVFYNIDSAQYQVDFSPIECCPQKIEQQTMWAKVIGNIYENPELLNNNQ